jgi:hypothetical protein
VRDRRSHRSGADPAVVVLASAPDHRTVNGAVNLAIVGDQVL